MTKTSVMRALFLVAAVAASHDAFPVHAATFEVRARIHCPASRILASGLIDPAFTTFTNVPCAGIRVVAMDSDRGPDEYCGEEFTDSRGEVHFRGECGDRVGRSPEVYLKVEGRSLNGFSVGVVQTNVIERTLDHLEDAWERFVEDGVPIPVPVLDALRSHQTFEWHTPWRRIGDGESVDFGDLYIGAGGEVSLMAARQLAAAQDSMFRLLAGTRYRPMGFNYTVDAPLPRSFTIAFVAWDTVIVDDTRNTGTRAAEALRATPHEIGHVLYNTYHSDNLHWLNEALRDYMKDHRRCRSERQTLAWYEGFANFVRDYVFQFGRWVWLDWDWIPDFRPFAGCAGATDTSVEGNVEALLNNIFFGPVRPALNMALNPNAPGLGFTCPLGRPPLREADGSLWCEVEVPAECHDGTLLVDQNGAVDQCETSREDRRCESQRQRCLQNCPNWPVTDCNCSPECEPIVEVRDVGCASGPAIRQSGRDRCTVRVPAQHTLPNGSPRPRPDGTPDQVLGVPSTGTPPGTLAWFSLPTLDDVVSWVDDAGTDAHRAREFWRDWILPWCRQRTVASLDHYCNPDRSATFAGERTTLDRSLD